MWGASTGNTRAERTWPEVGSQFARAWRAFFFRLERVHGLQRNNPNHLWLLHTLFLPSINEDCDSFVRSWNSHPISGKGHNKTPNDMRLLGQLEHGIYPDINGGVHPEVLQYYRVEEMEDKEEAERVVIANIREEQHSQYYHEPVAVPKHSSPFQENGKEVKMFARLLQELESSDFIPSNYRLTPGEWETGIYPIFETIPFGKRGNRRLEVPLPPHIWLKRAIQWVRCLVIMDSIMDSRQ
ncbi:uncharacterized protein C8R40DRAFT_1244409 [Lentinula edodes]|uniref:uncharacterized protein n=1 Tax=Lentinula edodes TaxID=5353 RepID=UPI001E8D250D|nr:uncharacterized protein C8R40DRAFT_1244409 [Lentinula edodes]KAH7879620.1 hypothetical protein C8R40DRAFT_1244409 [Lentinula edodes]